MPKAEFGTTKWMSNKIKASGLQKLRWYCQMCQKQCRDENGFKCHRMSEGHQRMMQVFIQNPNKFMDEFSQDFEREFMRLMRTRYCRTRVLANSVYNNIVADRQHIHMNATIWVTLSEFVQYLGSTNKCRIELTPKGWYVEYIDHEELKRLEDLQKRRKEELSQEEAKVKRLGELVEEAEKQGKFQQSVYTPLVRNEGEKVVIGSLKGTTKEGTMGSPRRLPKDILQQMAMGSDTVHSTGRKRTHSLTSRNTSGTCEAAVKCQALSGGPSGDGVSGSALAAHVESSGSLGRIGRSDYKGYAPPANKQRRLLAMERLRIEEEMKKQRAAQRGSHSDANSQAAYRKVPCRQSVEATDESVLLRGSVRAPIEVNSIECENRQASKSDNDGVRESAKEPEGLPILPVDPPFMPPPHKHKDKDWWLSKGLIVKVLRRTLGEGQYYKQKGRVVKVENRYSGYIQMLDSGAVLRLDQKDLETVIPNIGGWVRVTLGPWRDHEGVIDALDVENYSVHVVLKSGPLFKLLQTARPVVLKHVPYEHVCRLERQIE